MDKVRKITRLLITVLIAFAPQWLAQQESWQIRAIIALLSLAVLIFANNTITELSIGKGEVSLKMEQLERDTQTVKNLGLSMMKTSLIMIAYDDNSWQGLTPIQKIDVYHEQKKAQQQLDVTDDELEHDFKLAEKAIIRGFVNHFVGSPGGLQAEDIVRYRDGGLEVNFVALQRYTYGLPADKADHNQEYINAWQAFLKEIDY